MLPRNSSSGKLPANSKSTNPPKPPQNPIPKVGIKTSSTTKKSVLGVSNISVSIKNSKKTTDSSSKTKGPNSEIAESTSSEKGVQVDEVEIIANDCERTNERGDAPIIRLPSVRVIREIEKNRQLKRQQQLKARLSETRKFEEHAAKQEIHLTNLKEFMETGAITRKRDTETEERKAEEPVKPVADKTKNALEAYDRIKQKEEELLKLFNSI